MLPCRTPCRPQALHRPERMPPPADRELPAFDPIQKSKVQSEQDFLPAQRSEFSA